MKLSRQVMDTAVHGRSVVKLRDSLNISTWNVRTMRTDGKLEILEKEMQRLNIGCLGISETRWSGVGHFLSDSGSTVIYSGGDEHKHGVAVILNKSLSRALMGYNPISERLMTVRIAAKPWNLTFIQAYAPTNQATDDDKNAFYERLEQVYLQVPRQDIVIVGGDMNAKIGAGNPIGKYALGTMNDNGARLVNFARANAFVAANCLVRRHPRRLYTWKSFDLTCRNQIDYFLVQERWKSSICYCKAIQGADCDSDHSLLGIKFKLKLRRLQRPKASTRYDYSNAEQFQIELCNRFTTLARPEASDPENFKHQANATIQVSKCLSLIHI